MTEVDASPWPRQVLAPPPRDVNLTLAAFCGVFGSRWVENAIDNVERQSVEPVQVVMALNGHDADVLARLSQFQATSPHEVWIVVNETNLGPMGSFQRNRDLIRATWTAFLHQDDIYLEPHLEVLRDLAMSSPPTAVALFAGMGGVSEDGQKRTAPPPMDNAALRGEPPWVVVPEVIRRHPFPTPTLAVRTRTDVGGMAWYDSGAPDSEWFARLALLGTIHATDELTVLYRQPADSESSGTDWHTRAWLWSVSLARIVMSQEFLMMLRAMPRERRSAFAKELLLAIPARYPSAELFEYLQFVAAQRMCEAWDYTEVVSLGRVASTLAQWGPSAATRSIDSLSNGEGSPASDSRVNDLLGNAPRRSWLEKRGRSAYRRYGHKLPTGLRNASLMAYKAVRGGAS